MHPFGARSVPKGCRFSTHLALINYTPGAGPPAPVAVGNPSKPAKTAEPALTGLVAEGHLWGPGSRVPGNRPEPSNRPVPGTGGSREAARHGRQQPQTTVLAGKPGQNRHPPDTHSTTLGGTGRRPAPHGRRPPTSGRWSAGGRPPARTYPETRPPTAPSEPLLVPSGHPRAPGGRVSGNTRGSTLQIRTGPP